MKRKLDIVLASLVLAFAGEAFAQGGSGADSASPPPPAQAPAAPAPAAMPGNEDKPKKSTEEMLEKISTDVATVTKKVEGIETKVSAKPTDPKILVEGRTPWNGLALKMAEKDKKATLAFSKPIWAGQATFAGEITVPLDEETRRAALLGINGEKKAFQAKLSLDFNFMERDVRSYLNRDRDVQESASICKAYVKANPEEDGKGCDKDDQKVREWLGKVDEQASPRAIEGVFSRRIPKGVVFTAGIEFTGSFDRQKVYVDDVGAKKVDPRNKWSFSTTGVFRIFAGPYVAIPLRAGLNVEDGSKWKEFDRCSSLASSDPNVTGKTCEKAMVLDDDKGIQTTGHVEAGLVVVPKASDSWNLIPGVEARGRLEGLGGSDRKGHIFGTLLMVPTETPVASRFGVGVDWVYAFDDDTGSSPKFAAGDSWFVPFILAGGSL